MNTFEKLIPQGKEKKIVIFFVIALILLLCTSYFMMFGKEQGKPPSQTRKEYFKQIYTDSLINNKPQELQNFFVGEIKNGNNDDLVKSAAYFITHRYFDSKGNIYELYDYSHSDPALAFLTKAEEIYPEIFKEIIDKKLPAEYSESGNLAYLAYLEVLANNGYSDLAVFGTAANQYAKLAYISREQTGKRTREAAKNISKSLFFAKKADPLVLEIISSGMNNGTYPSSLVVGLNQYAHALRYYSALSVPFPSSVTAEKVFSFTIEYTARFVPEFVSFTHILNLSSLTMIGSPSDVLDKAAVSITAINPNGKNIREYSVIDRITKARLGAEDEGIYSKKNIVKIAIKSPEFKRWLISAGWADSDFN